MDNTIKLNNEIKEDKDNAILRMMSETSIYPMLKESEVGVSNYTPLPLSRLAAYGTAFQPLATAVQTAVGGAGGSGIYYVNTAGKTMFQMIRKNQFRKAKKQMSRLIEHQSNFVRPFIENIDTINELNNKPVQLVVDKENLYIATIA